MKTMSSRRKRNCLAGFGVFLTMAALIIGMTSCGGCNECDQPPSQNLEIRTWYDLDAVRDNLAGHHTLMNGLDSTTPGYDELASPTANGGKGWQPIGGNSPGGCWRFIGTLDGQGYEICDMSINQPDRQDVGVFGTVGRKGVVENIGAVDVTVTGRLFVGGLVGSNYEGTVRDSYCTGTVAGAEGVGGLVGLNGGTVTNCYSTGSVTGNSEVGGLVGSDYDGAVSDSFWDTETSGQPNSPGGTGKTTAEMKSITTFSGAGWNITAVVSPDIRSPSYIWNIVDGETYPFLSWQATS